MDLSHLINKLHPLERKVVPFLKDNITLKELQQKTKLQEVEVMRALQWLENKEVLKLTSSEEDFLVLDVEGEKYKDLPERILIRTLTKLLTIKEIKEKTKLSDQEINASIGILKRKAALISKNNKFELSENGEILKVKETPEESLFKRLKSEKIKLSELKELEKLAYQELIKRKGIIKIQKEKTKTITLTALGKKILNEKIEQDVIDKITPEVIKQKTWKKFRAYDIKINVPKIHRGKRHFINQSINYVKKIWLEMGFEEMEGPIIQSAFWDLDSLFVPQDHPAREMQDTFYLNKKAKLPKYLFEKVKSTHEKGWKYKFNKEESEKVLLRTHTTVLSARTISKLKKSDLPKKYFCIGLVFRNEALDAHHLFEFHQVEGIVIDPNANFRHLLGYLKEFYKKMGYKDVRIRPAHFPYTEPSVEVEVLLQNNKWIELGGAGIFRPEVVKPLLGFEYPVLAWGQGLGRIVSKYYGLEDIRDFNKNNLKQIREIKEWMI